MNHSKLSKHSQPTLQYSLGTTQFPKKEASQASTKKPVAKDPKDPKKKRKLDASDMQNFDWLNPVKPVVDDEAVAAKEGPSSMLESWDNIKPDPDLVAYLQQRLEDKEGGEDNADLEMDVRVFLSNPPYKGKHVKGYKESIKDLGLRWVKNPDFVEGAGYDPMCPPGWFAASTLRDLHAVLQLPATAKDKRVWHPWQLAGEDFACSYLLSVITEFYADQKRTVEANQKKMEEQRKRQAEAVAASTSMVSSNDSATDIAELLGAMRTMEPSVPEYVYDAAAIASSASEATLGPMMCSNAKRVFRALHLKLLTPAQVAQADWEPDHVKQMRALTERRRAGGAGTKITTAPASHRKEITKNETRKEKEEKVEEKEEEVAVLQTDEYIQAQRARADAAENQAILSRLWDVSHVPRLPSSPTFGYADQFGPESDKS